ncbi:hypothetical protein D9M68_974500 [compost metagenome]
MSSSVQTTDLRRRSCACAFAYGEAPSTIRGRRLKTVLHAPMSAPIVSALWVAMIFVTVWPATTSDPDRRSRQSAIKAAASSMKI